MALIQQEYFYSQECHLMDRGYQVLACDSILEKAVIQRSRNITKRHI